MKRLWIALCVACLFPIQATSFSLTGNSWENESARLYVGRENFFWQTKMREAAEDWNENTDFRFRVSPVSHPPCDEDGFLLNGFEFREVDCSETEFGEFVLAVAEWLPDEDGFTQQAGITFNSNVEWGSYSGPVHEVVVDFNRVAIHELGHMLGLGHEDNEPSIMNSIISDGNDITADDRAGVDAIYGDGPPPDPGGDPDPDPDPGTGGANVEEKCQTSQLSSAASYCKKHVKCEAKYVKDPAKDPGGAGRDACQAKARADFLANWNDAIGDASSAGGSCANQDSAATVDSIVDLASLAIEAGIGGGDPLNSVDRKMRQKVMKKAASMCQKDFGAYQSDVTQQDPVKLANDLANARAKFLNSANKAILKAANSGVAYDGDPLDTVADQTEQLASDFGALVAP